MSHFLKLLFSAKHNNPSPAGEGRVRGYLKMLNACLILLTPALSIRRGGKLSAICGISDSLNVYLF